MDQTERRILDAAIVIFSRYGFRQTSVGQVAEEAGLSRQALYRLFENKEALFLAALKDINEAALAHAATAGEEAHRAGADLATCLSAQVIRRLTFYAERLGQSPHANELFEESFRQFSTVWAEYNTRFLETLIATMEKTYPGTTLHNGLTARQLAFFLLAGVRGLKRTIRSTQDSDDFLKEATAIIQLLVEGATERG